MLKRLKNSTDFPSQSAERWASGAAGSGSEVRADAGSRRLHAVIRLGQPQQVLRLRCVPRPAPALPGSRWYPSAGSALSDPAASATPSPALSRTTARGAPALGRGLKTKLLPAPGAAWCLPNGYLDLVTSMAIPLDFSGAFTIL